MNNEFQSSTAEYFRNHGAGEIDQAAEMDLWSGGFSATAMAGLWIAAGLMTGLVLGAMLTISVLRQNETVWIAAGLLILLVWSSLVGIFCYRKWSRWYELTSQRLRHRDGFLLRTIDRIELIDVDDVNYRQGPIQAMLGVGNITLSSSDTSHPQLVMYGIRNVRNVADLIDDARRAERRKRGLHVEAI